MTVRPARADAYDAALTRAVAAKERALDSRVPGDWEQALDGFQQAHALRSAPETSYEIGYAAEMLRQDDLAVEAYEAAVEEGLSGPGLERAKKFVQAHASEMGRLDIRGPEGTKLRLRGAYRATLPLDRPLVLFTGETVVSFEAPDGSTESRTVELRAGERRTLELDKADEPEPPSNDVPESRRQVSSHGSRTSAEPPSPPPKPDRPAPVEDSSSPLAWALVASGTGLAAVSGAVVFVAFDRIDTNRISLEALCAELDGPDQCPVAKSDADVPLAQEHVNAIETWKAVRLGAWVGLGAGVATAAAGALLLALAPDPGQGAGLTLGVAPTVGGAVLSCGRRF